MSKTRTFKVGRNAASGRFTKVITAQKKKRTHIVETIRVRVKRKK